MRYFPALILLAAALMFMGPASAQVQTFDTGLLEGDESASVIFETEGNWEYICGPHPYMEGTVIVAVGAAVGSFTVTIEDYSFSPAELELGPGSTVNWINQDSVAHSATGGIDGAGTEAGGHHGSMMMGGWNFSWIWGAWFFMTLVIVLFFSFARWRRLPRR